SSLTVPERCHGAPSSGAGLPGWEAWRSGTCCGPRPAPARSNLPGPTRGGGLALGDLVGAEARAGSVQSAASDKAMIVLWLWGGPSHMETFDLKPEAPQEYRGEFNPIATNVPGIEISEHLPLL